MNENILNTINRIYPTNKFSETLSNKIREIAIKMELEGYSNKEIMKVIGGMVSSTYVTGNKYKETEPLVSNAMSKDHWSVLLYILFLFLIVLPVIFLFFELYPPFAIIVLAILLFYHFEIRRPF